MQKWEKYCRQMQTMNKALYKKTACNIEKRQNNILLCYTAQRVDHNMNKTTSIKMWMPQQLACLCF